MNAPHHIKLYNLPQNIEGGIKIHGFKSELDDSDKELTLRFHHLDGMYSVCSVEGEKDSIVHLSASTPLVELGNDEYRIEYNEEEDRSY
jgi:hypothetical protein